MSKLTEEELEVYTKYNLPNPSANRIYIIVPYDGEEPEK